MSLRLAVLGLGSHARGRAIPALARTRGVSLAGVWTRRDDVAHQVAAALGVPRFESFEAALASSAVDAVYLAGPNSTHAPWAMKALAAGKHVCSEKSLSCSLADTLALLADARRRQLVLDEAWQFPTHPQFALVREVLARDLGPLRQLDAAFGVPHFVSRSDVRYQRALGGGALLDVGAYPVHLASILSTGEPLISGRVDSEPGHEVDTRGAVQLSYPDGLVAQLSWGFGLGYRNEATLWGTRGVLHVPFAFTKRPEQRTTLRLVTSAGESALECPAADHFVSMFEQFALAARSPPARAATWARVERHARLLFEVVSATGAVTAPA